MSEFLWLDLETTGLDPDRDIVLEFAVVLVDDGPGGTWEELGSYQSVITPYEFAGCPPREIIAGADNIVQRMHTRNGLFAELENPELCCTIEEADAYLAALTPEGLPSLAGNSVHFDKTFLRRHMPEFHSRLSHRVFDVSTLVRAERTYGDKSEQAAKPIAHRALEDVRASIATARRFIERRFAR